MLRNPALFPVPLMAQRLAELAPMTSAEHDVAAVDEAVDDVDYAWNAQIEYLLQRHSHWGRATHDRRRMRIALAIALVLHVLLLVALRQQMHQPAAMDDREDVIQIRLLQPELVPEPEPVAPTVQLVQPDAPGTTVVADRPTVARVTRTTTPSSAPASAASAVIAAHSVETLPVAPRIYGVTGRLLVDPKLALTPPPPGPLDFVAPRFVSPLMMQHRTPLPYEPTRFDEGWTPDHETRLGEFVRKNTHTVSTRTRWGGQISCSWMLFMGGCSFGYAPPNPEGLKRLRENPPFKPALAPAGTQRAIPVPELPDAAAEDGQEAPSP